LAIYFTEQGQSRPHTPDDRTVVTCDNVTPPHQTRRLSRDYHVDGPGGVPRSGRADGSRSGPCQMSPAERSGGLQMSWSSPPTPSRMGPLMGACVVIGVLPLSRSIRPTTSTSTRGSPRRAPSTPPRVGAT
jgi:hypothetical protein